MNRQQYEAKSGRAASDLTYQQYEPKFRGETGQQHNLPRT